MSEEIKNVLKMAPIDVDIDTIKKLTNADEYCNRCNRYKS